MTKSCQICGNATGAPTEIFDKEFGITNNSCKVCPTCFRLWSTEERKELYTRMGNKVKGVKNA